MNPQDQTPQPQVHNPLNSMQTGERNIFEVKRHPIGMLGMYISAGFVLLIVAALAFIIAPLVLPNMDHTQLIGYGAIAFLIIAVLVAGFILISHVVYWGNRWILTTDSLTQVTQRSLFDKQNSQLSLGNLEDVTAQQNGILAHMFNFGALKVETAGERSKFLFPFCPNPNYYAQQILNAREQFEQDIRNQTGNQGLTQNQPPAAYQPPANPGSIPSSS